MLDGQDIIKASEYKSQQLSQTPPTTTELREESPLLIERLSEQSNEGKSRNYPISRHMDKIDLNYVTPEVHFAYSVTWYCHLIVFLTDSFKVLVGCSCSCCCTLCK